MLKSTKISENIGGFIPNYIMNCYTITSILYHSSSNINNLLIHYIYDNYIIWSCLFTTSNLLSNNSHNITNSGYILPNVEGKKYTGNYILLVIEPISIKDYFKYLKNRKNLLSLYRNIYDVEERMLQMIASFVLSTPVSKVNMTW